MPAERIALATLLAPDNRAPLERVATAITEGAVVVYPTETIYGIGGRADSGDVHRRIVAAKRRPPDQPMILIAGRRSSFSSLDISFPSTALRLAAAFWPGPLTLILPSSGSREGRAVRISDHPFLTAIAPFCSVPLYSTSANQSGVPYCPDPETIYTVFEKQADFMIDAGTLPASAPSTLVRVAADGAVTVLREGGIPAAAIDTALGC